MAASTEVRVPDIGDFADVPVIDIAVAVGDAVNVDDSLVTLESDKATMDIPSPVSGTVSSIAIKVGDRIGEGAVILTLSGDAAEEHAAPASAPAPQPTSEPPPASAVTPAPAVAPAAADARPSGPSADLDGAGGVHAGPSVRRLARELEIDLASIAGTGQKGRITKQDLLGSLHRPAEGAAPAAAATGGGIPPIPAQDFAKFGEIETVALSRIKRISGPHLHRSWVNVPHVTHNDDADITDLEAYRKQLDADAKSEGYRVTLLAFLLKVVVSGMKSFPELNSSLAPDGASLIYKKYYNIGIAVDTPDGLVVPVLRDVDRKGITALSKEMGEISKKARDGKLSAADLSGGCFTISSLGGIGGTSFTPIVNAPEVAILGVVRSKLAPVWDGAAFAPRLMLPLSLSYDHRVVDGALAARFTRHLVNVLEDPRRLVL